MTRRGLLWYVGADEEGYPVPWWLGYVRRVELSTELAPIPLNLVLAGWARLHRALQYTWASRLERWGANRAALRRAYERGRAAGHHQGHAAGAAAAWRSFQRREWAWLRDRRVAAGAIGYTASGTPIYRDQQIGIAADLYERGWLDSMPPRPGE